MRKVILLGFLVSLMLALALEVSAGGCDPDNGNCPSADCNSIFADYFHYIPWSIVPESPPYDYCYPDYGTLVVTDAYCDGIESRYGVSIGSSNGPCAAFYADDYDPRGVCPSFERLGNTAVTYSDCMCGEGGYLDPCSEASWFNIIDKFFQGGGGAVCGNNVVESGEVCDGTDLGSYVPDGIIGAGAFHSCAMLSGGTVKCWGRNNYGQCGDGTTTTPRQTPVSVLGVTNAVQLSVGGYHSCVLFSDGTINCWGYNTN